MFSVNNQLCVKNQSNGNCNYETLILWNLKYEGNIGTIIRTAHLLSYGFKKIVIISDTPRSNRYKKECLRKAMNGRHSVSVPVDWMSLADDCDKIDILIRNIRMNHPLLAIECPNNYYGDTKITDVHTFKSMNDFDMNFKLFSSWIKLAFISYIFMIMMDMLMFIIPINVILFILCVSLMNTRKNSFSSILGSELDGIPHSILDMTDHMIMISSAHSINVAQAFSYVMGAFG